MSEKLDFFNDSSYLNISDSEATVVYNSIGKFYGDGRFIVKHYSRNFKRIKEGYELKDEDYSLPGEPLDIERDNSIDLIDFNHDIDKDVDFRSDNLTRSRNLIIDLACQNYKEFKSFVTLTFSDNITDIDIANKKLHSYLVSVRRAFPNFKYLGVPEFQKGGRVHYHLMTNIEVDSDLIPKRKKIHTFNQEKNKHTWIDYYNLKYWNHGFSSAFSIATCEENFSITLYVLKYLYKSPDIRLFGRNKVLSSRNLDKPDIVYLSTESEEYKKVLNYIYDHDYDTYTFDSDNSFVPSFIQYSNIK